MQLQFISVARLVIDAGGDPWAINDSLQAGRPAQISDLAQAFHGAGQSTTESDTTFAQARQRFAASWNRENGQHPINDAAEVRRVTKSLGLQAAQLPNIAVDLENIAAALAEAQRESGWYIAALDADLADIDDEIGDALEDGDQDDADDLYQDAVDETNAVLYQVTQIRDAYSTGLQNALAVLRADGGDPAEIKGADELLIPPPDTNPEQVKRWWDSLTEEQQRLLIDLHPQELGNLNGIQAEVRGHVNVDVLNDVLHRVEDIAGQFGLRSQGLRDNALNGVNSDLFSNPEKYGLTATDIIRYQNAVKTNKGLEHDRGDSNNARPVMLWAYDPLAFNGYGRAAIAIGDPDNSRNHDFK